MKSPIPSLRKIALAEGVSLLLLLGVAMPLKYVWDMPAAVKVAGWAHGLLFILFCAALARTAWMARWPMSRSARVLIAGLLPFGPFVVDRRMPDYEAEFQARQRR